jgi:D-beta-D-heptose 7-phosphate kinase/D-beta-D-heptose 1-phosphate adenosyltransferase
MSKPRLVIVGDLMLDVTALGTVSRLSPEAPVPILVNPTRRSALGGAGNTANNVRHLGAIAALVAARGDDESGQVCACLLAESGIEDQVIIDRDVPTSTKTRFVAASHQILRLDEERTGCSSSVEQAILTAYCELVGLVDSVVISDYGKGVVSPKVARAVIDEARKAGVSVVVDSKARDLSRFCGASVLTPNHLEATAATGRADPEQASEILARQTGASVIVTLGPQGMLVREHGGALMRVASQVHEVADVTGAGDTVTAAVAVALSEGATVPEAARWATTAAAIAVERFGTYAVSREDVGSGSWATRRVSRVRT